MSARISLPFVFILACVVAFLDLIAIRFYLYWRLWWFDMPVHFLGGLLVSVAVLTAILLAVEDKERFSSKFSLLTAVMIFSFFFGVLWELFEYAEGFAFGPLSYPLDTVKDLVMDMAGAASGYFLLVGRR